MFLYQNSISYGKIINVLSQSFTAKTLLLVDDDAIVSLNQKMSLEKFGYEVITASDSDDAVTVLKDFDIDLILMDIDFGKDKIDGIAAASLILQDFDIPIIFLTAHTEPGTIVRAGNVKSYGYMEKNINTGLLDHAIKTALRLFYMEEGLVQSELEKTRIMLNDVLNAIPIRVFWKDLAGVYMGCNRLFAMDSGRNAPEDITGLTDFDIRTREIAEQNRTDDRTVIESGKPKMNYEEPFPIEGSGKTSIVTSKIPLRNSAGDMYGILGMYEDISHKIKMEEELVLQKNRLANILYGSNVGTWEWNVQTGENIVNEHWAEILGYALDELPVKDRDFWKSFVHPEDISGVDELLDSHFNNEAEYFESEFRMRHKDGRWVWILSRGKVSSLTEDGGPLIVSGTHLDINERKLAQEGILQQLSEKDLILKEVHHRIKNNFSSIGSLLTMQADSTDNEEAREALLDATGRVHSMELLYEKLLTADDYRNTSLGYFLEDLVEDIVNIFTDKTDVRIEKSFCECELKPNQLFSLGIIVNELITNVMKYAFAGRASGIIRIVLERNEDSIILVVHDDGNGLPEGFDMDKQEGFGLMLINILSRQLDGQFTIENSGGAKSTLKFKAPKLQ